MPTRSEGDVVSGVMAVGGARDRRHPRWVNGPRRANQRLPKSCAAFASTAWMVFAALAIGVGAASPMGAEVSSMVPLRTAPMATESGSPGSTEPVSASETGSFAAGAPTPGPSAPVRLGALLGRTDGRRVARSADSTTGRPLAAATDGSVADRGPLRIPPGSPLAGRHVYRDGGQTTTLSDGRTM